MGSGDDLGLLATKPEAAAGKKRKMLEKTRLPQEVLDEITCRPVTPLPANPDDGFSNECRAAFADTKELVALVADDITRQCKDNGYAVVEEKKVTNDGEEKTEDNGCPTKKRKKLVKIRLSQGLVDEIMRNPVTPFPVIADDVLAGFSDEFRAELAMQKADTEKLMALDADIIRQYKDHGYAELEEEVTDDED